MMVKICGITRREDAEAAVEAGASALGFIFYPKSPRYVTPSVAAALGKGFDHILKVGIFVDESPAAIEAIMAMRRLSETLLTLESSKLFPNCSPEDPKENTAIARTGWVQ